MCVAVRQKLTFEPAKINIISHTTKQLQNFSVESGEFRVERFFFIRVVKGVSVVREKKRKH